MELLGRVREHMAGRHFWNGLSRYAKLGYFRQRREVDAREGEMGVGVGAGGVEIGTLSGGVMVGSGEGVVNGMGVVGGSRVGSEEEKGRGARRA